uniref:Uncharacterized protein n=1 Tax=Siphoviridae sp. ctXZx16 TaxID=2826371 RepID=A0A8S5MKW3_9CAUD|nr:MAG TPA: hypothetical protein [Siphoviridae sp. ctXZx16]
MRISSDIDSVITFLKEKKKEGYKSVELVDDERARGWATIDPEFGTPVLKFIFNEREKEVIGIDVRTKETKYK